MSEGHNRYPLGLGNPSKSIEHFAPNVLPPPSPPQRTKSDSKGFGATAPRFIGKLTNECPGPGSYAAPKPAVAPKAESLSKKGFGSMVSRDQRFKPLRKSSMPGPGFYSQRATLEVSSDKYFNKSGSTSAFKPPGTVPLPTSSTPTSSPGPGAYDAIETRTGHKLDPMQGSQGAGHASAFKSTRSSRIFEGGEDAPAPGAYDLRMPWPTKSPHRSPRHRSQNSHHDSLIPRIATLVYGEDDRPQDGPGPGAYDAHTFHSVERKVQVMPNVAAASFVPGERTDKFGRPTQGEPLAPTPGPGAYFMETNSSPPSTSVGPRSMFSSTAPAHTFLPGTPDVPGPAYYDPKQPPIKRSFHLNARKHYVTRP